MTVKELSQLRYLDQVIEGERRRLDMLEAERPLLKATQMDGMPRAPGYGDPISQAVIDTERLRAKIMESYEQHRLERNRLLWYIDAIPDTLTKSIFEFKFRDGLSWAQIAVKMGGGNSYAGVRSRVYRYLNADNEQE